METHLAPETLRALLEWQVELGATEAIGDVPVNRYDAPARVDAASTLNPTASVATGPKRKALPPLPRSDTVDHFAEARDAVAGVQDLDGLRRALAGFEGCELKKGARNLVFSDGTPGARVMVIGEAPGRDEDIQGKPFVGRAGQFLDRMFAAIALGRERDGDGALYITNILPWRPPENRDPEPDEIAMMLPFVQRHIELAAPDLIVLMGNIACQALLGRKGITRLRGKWAEAAGRPALPMLHPAYLLRKPAAKREAWHDLLLLQARLRG